MCRNSSSIEAYGIEAYAIPNHHRGIAASSTLTSKRRNHSPRRRGLPPQPAADPITRIELTLRPQTTWETSILGCRVRGEGSSHLSGKAAFRASFEGILRSDSAHAMQALCRSAITSLRRLGRKSVKSVPHSVHAVKQRCRSQNAKIVTHCSVLWRCVRSCCCLVHLLLGRSQQHKDGRAPAKLRRGSREKRLQSLSSEHLDSRAHAVALAGKRFVESIP